MRPWIHGRDLRGFDGLRHRNRVVFFLHRPEAIERVEDGQLDAVFGDIGTQRMQRGDTIPTVRRGYGDSLTLPHRRPQPATDLSRMLFDA